MGKAGGKTLCGENNPSGKLPETFPKHIKDVKSLENYPGNEHTVVYEERMMVGYRHFDTNHFIIRTSVSSFLEISITSRTSFCMVFGIIPCASLYAF